MNHTDREKIAALLLSARGWLSCWFPVGSSLENLPDELMFDGVRANNLVGSIEKIDLVLEMVGHEGNGVCTKDEL